MTKRMLIEACHDEETRVAIVDDNKLLDFEYETTLKKQTKGNVYLGKIVRVEPSLQAAFVEYGGKRQGFLSFSEIHPDYFRLPVEDRPEATEPSEDAPKSEEVKQYKIQEVIQNRQVVLIQVVKEERGNKGAALTTFISLAGRYCVLIPNANNTGGVSRKITDTEDRKRLRQVVQELELPEGMALIIRTAGMDRSKPEIKRDFKYLSSLWTEIREETLKATAPCLVYEEADLVKRAVRDYYTREIEEILIEGEEQYKIAKNMMRKVVPSHAKKVQLYKEDIPLFHKYGIEKQIDQIFQSQIKLKSGGYIVINPTEAMVSIDVNSGKATKERHIDTTALKTNLEAAEEIARQIRLRDLAGLIVIDFIDMTDAKHNAAVERRFKESIAEDRARIQLGRISNFGLMELSRQRLRPSSVEKSSGICEHCDGTGFVRSTESMALQILRLMGEHCIMNSVSKISITLPARMGFYLLNEKRADISAFEKRFHVSVELLQNDLEYANGFKIEDQDRNIICDTKINLAEEDGNSKSDKKRTKKDTPKKEVKPKIVRPDLVEEEILPKEDEPSEEAEIKKDDVTEKPKRRRKRNRTRSKQNAAQNEAPNIPVPSDEIIPPNMEILDLEIDDAIGNKIEQSPDKNKPRKPRRNGGWWQRLVE